MDRDKGMACLHKFIVLVVVLVLGIEDGKNRG
jgi:hypothetical protein